MRVTISLTLAAALFAATPAMAQNEAAPANTTATTTTTTNETANAATAVPPASAGNELAAVNDMPNNGVAPVQAPAEKKGFPWGVIGLVGLIGLIPRRRS